MAALSWVGLGGFLEHPWFRLGSRFWVGDEVTLHPLASSPSLVPLPYFGPTRLSPPCCLSSLPMPGWLTLPFALRFHVPSMLSLMPRLPIPVGFPHVPSWLPEYSPGSACDLQTPLVPS